MFTVIRQFLRVSHKKITRVVHDRSLFYFNIQLFHVLVKKLAHSNNCLNFFVGRFWFCTRHLTADRREAPDLGQIDRDSFIQIDQPIFAFVSGWGPAHDQGWNCSGDSKFYSGDLNTDHVNTGNICIQNFLKFKFKMVWYSNGQSNAMSYVLDQPLEGIPDQYIRKQNGVHLSCIQMVGLSGIQMVFKNQTIWHLDLTSFWPFEYQD